MSSDAIFVQDLEKSFKTGFLLSRKKVLNGVSFQVSSGSITGFIGANGAGKTTVLKCLLQVIFPDQGVMKIFDQDVSLKSTRKMIGFLPERPYFHEFLTGDEFLSFHGQLMGLSGSALRQRRESVLNQVGLADVGVKKLKSYSKGMLQRIGIGQALMVQPKLLILDEPMSGLDPDGRLLVKSLIRDIAKNGTSVFFSSHLLHDAEELCNSLVCLKEGVVIYNDSVERLLRLEKNEVRIEYCERDSLRVKIVSEDILQEVIDQLRQNNCSVVQVQRCSRSLEEAVGGL